MEAGLALAVVAGTAAVDWASVWHSSCAVAVEAVAAVEGRAVVVAVGKAGARGICVVLA